MRAGGDLAHVPDHRTLRVEIGGADQQDAAAAILGRDVVQHPAVHILGDQLLEGRRIREQFRTEQARQDLRRRQIGGVVLGPDLAQLVIVGGTQERKRRDQGAGADARHHLELRPVAALGPAGQQARTERAIAGAARQRQVLDHRPLPEQAGRHGHALGGRHMRAHEAEDVARRLVAPEAGVRQAWDRCVGDQRGRHRRAHDTRSTAAERDCHRAQNQRQTTAVRARHHPQSAGGASLLLAATRARTRMLRQPPRRSLTAWLHRCFPVVTGECGKATRWRRKRLGEVLPIWAAPPMLPP